MLDIILPEKVLLLTVGADVQTDRIEAETIGWGPHCESWGIQYAVFRGNTELPQLWAEFDLWIQRMWKHPSGHMLNAACTCIDSGNKPASIYAYVDRCSPRMVFAVKGSRGYSPIWVSRSGNRNQRLFMLQVDTAKEALYSRLRLTEYGPGYCHFPSNPEQGYDLAYFQMLTSETLRTSYSGGHPVRHFELIAQGARNESLDARVYGMAALEILNPDWEACMQALLEPPLHDWRPKKDAPQVEQKDQGLNQFESEPPRRRATGWSRAY